MINTGQGFYAGATNAGAAATRSPNRIPDFIAKVAVEEDVAGHHMHADAFGMTRSFYEQFPDFKTNNIITSVFGAGLTAQIIPGWFDMQASGLTGKGIDQYGSGQLPDATFNANGHIVPIQETIALVGGIAHAAKDLDIYTYGVWL